MSVYPSLDELLAAKVDDNLLEVHRSLRSILSSFAIFLLSVLGLYGVVYFAGVEYGRIDVPYFGTISVRWLAIVPALVLIEIVRKYHDDLYIITAGRTTHHEGRLSLSSKVPSLKHEDIRSISVHQDIIGRMFNYGNVLLSSAAQGGVELTMTGIHAPREIASILDQLRTFALNKQKSQQNEGTSLSAMGA